MSSRKRRAHSKAAVQSRWKKHAAEMVEDLSDAATSPTCTTTLSQHTAMPFHSFGKSATTMGSVMHTEPDSPIKSSTNLDEHTERYACQNVLGYAYTLL